MAANRASEAADLIATVRNKDLLTSGGKIFFENSLAVRGLPTRRPDDQLAWFPPTPPGVYLGNVYMDNTIGSISAIVVNVGFVGEIH